MNILHLLYESENDPFGFGGAAIRMYNIYGHLRERHRITLVCRKYPGARDSRIHGLEHLFVGRETDSFASALLHYSREARRFVNKCGEAFDIIIEEFSPATPMFLHTYRKKPVVLQVQGFTGSHYLWKYPLYYSLPLYLLEKIRPYFYNRTLHVSEDAASHFMRRAGSRATIISNGIDRNLLALEPCEENYILYLGRLDIHHKGLDLLLTAFARLAHSHPQLRLKLVGDGKDRRSCRALVERLPGRVRSRVEFCGWLNGFAKRQQLRKALCVVVPSRYETQGIVVLEAAACGKPLVVSDIDSLKYIVNAGGALPFRSRDPLDLAGQIKRIADNASLRQALARNGRRWVENFTWEQVAQQFETFLEQVVHESSPTNIRK